MAFEINFTSPVLNENYQSKDEYEADAMNGTVYLITNSVLQSIVGSGNLFPDSVRNALDLDDPIKFLDALMEDWQEIITTNRAFCVAVIFGLIMTIIMPIAGIIWCCCKCCCSGKKGLTGPRKSSDAVCIGLGVTLVTLISVLFGVFGCVWYFASNSVLQTNVENLPTTLKTSFSDVDLFVNNTVLQVENLVFDNFNQTRGAFNQTLDETAGTLSEVFTNITTAIQFNELVEKSEEIIDVTTSFNNGTRKYLNDSIFAFQDQVTSLKEILLELSTTIGALAGNPPNPLCVAIAAGPIGKTCEELAKEFSDMSGNIEFNLPSLDAFEINQETLDSIGSFRQVISDAQSLLDNFSSDFLLTQTASINEKLNSIEESVQDSVKDLIKNLRDFSSDFKYEDIITPDIEDAIQFFPNTVSPALLSPMIFLAIILFLMFIGLMLGCCGSVGGSAKRWGSTCISISVGFLFLFGFFLWIFTVILFFAGALSEKVVCDTIRNPDTSEFSKQINDIFQTSMESLTNSTMTNLTLTQLMDKCAYKNDDGGADGEAIYSLLNLETLFNLTELEAWESTYNISEEITNFMNRVELSIDDVRDKTILDPKILEEINNNLIPLMESVRTQVIDAFDSIDVTQVIQVDKIKEYKSGFEQAGASVPEAVPILELFNKTTDTIADLVERLEVFKNIENDPAVSPALNLPAVIDEALQILDNAPDYIDMEGREEIIILADKTANDVISVVDQFVTHAIEAMKKNIGRCGPILQIYNGLLTVGLCHDLLDPFNGLWSGVGMVLFFMIPGLFLLCCLDGLFRREKKRPQYAQADLIREAPVLMETKFAYTIPDYYKGKQRK